MDTAEHPESPQIIEHLPADGGRRHPTANTLADFMRMLEDGQFDADVTHELRELAGDLENLNQAQGGNTKLKAKLTVTVDIVREPDGIYMLTPNFVIKRPVEVRKRSVAWLTDDNLFTPNKPNQGNLFGTIRDVSANRGIRN